MVQSGWVANYFTTFRLSPICQCFLAKEKEPLGVWWEKQSDVPVKKTSKKTQKTKYKEAVHSNLSWKKCRKTLERPWEHMFKWVLHEMFHNRNGCQTIKCAAVSHLFFFFFFLRVCTVSLWRVRVTCYFRSFPRPLTLATERCKCPKNIMAAFLFKNEAVKEDN